MGHFRQALELDQRTYELKLRLFGADDRRSIVTQTSVAMDMRETGDYLGGLLLHGTMQKIHQTIFGPENPATLEVTRQLSKSCRKAGDHARSLDLATVAYTQFVRRDGTTPDHWPPR